MKKGILSAVLVSGVTLGAATTVGAEDFSTKIAAQNSIISTLTAEQQAAQNQVSALQAQVSSLQSQQDELAAKNAELEAQSSQFEQEIQALANKIIVRNEKLKNQARSAQKGHVTSSYINTLLNSKSISDVINRLVAIREVVSANEKMLEQQKADQAAIQEKQDANQAAINTIAANMATIRENQNALRTQQADLEVAKVNLAIQLASAEDEKASLLNQQAASVEAAKSAIIPVAEVPSASQTSSASEPAPMTPAPSAVVAPTVTPVAPAVRPQVSYDSSNTYPVGQCTWGVKSLAPWAGNNWGNGGQWAASAQAQGFTVSSTPVPGAIAVWNDGGYGHVAYVSQVQSASNIRVMESNYAGNMYINDYRGWFNPTGAVYILPR